jgi:hypothetical protein
MNLAEIWYGKCSPCLSSNVCLSQFADGDQAHVKHLQIPAAAASRPFAARRAASTVNAISLHYIE